MSACGGGDLDSEDAGSDAHDDGDADAGSADAAEDADDEPAEQCDNGEDDDGDGLVDCLDEDCAEAPACRASRVAAGWNHACATFEDGRVRCWGDDSTGALGDDRIERETRLPVVVDGIQDALDVAVGDDFSCALHESGKVSCWGTNDEGHLGDSTYIDTPAPVAVAGLDDAVALSAGLYHACAVREHGEVVCWGENDRGQLGDNSTEPRNAPVEVELFKLAAVEPIDDAVDIDCHAEHCCARRSNGQAACWGYNDRGMLAAGVDSEQSEVALVAATETNPMRYLDEVEHLTTAYLFSCFVRSDDSLWCAGEVPSLRGDFDQWPRVAVEMEDFGEVTDVWAGTAHACALRPSGRVLCWGNNQFHQTGSSEGDYSNGHQLSDIDDPRDVSLGDDCTCYVDTDGGLFCFGLNDAGQLGVETDEESVAEPQRVLF